MHDEPPFDALLLFSFGGPEGPDDVLPFLENVTRGKNVPRARLEAVAEHYMLFDGVSPINEHLRALLVAVIDELNRSGPSLPVFWANRFWRPLLPEVLAEMAEQGIRRALAFVTSAFGSYPGCRAYREAINEACASLGPASPRVEKIRLFYDHPDFIAAQADRVRRAVEVFGGTRPRVLFTAHSIPQSMAAAAPYERQLHEACRWTADQAGITDWQLAYQSRSGPPNQPWLEPSVEDTLAQWATEGCRRVVLAPIGFLVEHMEVAYDLDIEAAQRCEQLGIKMVRASTVGGHPRLTTMIRKLVAERFDPNVPRESLRPEGPPPDVCPPDCCRTASPAG